MKKDYATIAASTIAALLLAVSPAAAGGDGKKAEGGISTESSTSVTTETKTDGSVSAGGSVSGTTGGAVILDSPSASPKMSDDKDKLDAEKKTGLDNADQKAGEHGQQGRDNAREKQERKDSPAASPSTEEPKKDEGTSQEKK